MNSSPSEHQEPTLPPAAHPVSTATAGTKRPAPSLLPPFEPLSSSPGLPRPAKRQATGKNNSSAAYLKYPTPIPTSSTGILSSSPPRATSSTFARTQSSLSERAPLSAVPTIVLNGNGETLLMGRSSNSSNYQLSANRLISRVHVKARYVPAASPLEPNKIEIVCNGWNGLKLHCQGRTYELWKGDSFTSETEGTEMMLDVQDARVMVQWPKSVCSPDPSEASWGDSPRSRVGGGGNTPGGFLQSSPLRRSTRIESPVSPTPANLSSSKRLQMLLPTTERDSHDNVEIYVDPSADEDDAPQESRGRVADPNSSISTDLTNSFSSDLSDPDYDDDENDPNEENDPIVHSFGPFGANLSDRLASITASSPKVNRSPNNRGRLPPVRERESTSEFTSENPGAPEEEAPKAPFENPVLSNHVVNQLAYSRLSSTPLSAIMQNLPADERKDVTKEQLQSLIEGTACIGVISRQGKDAAGKALESEYYYVPEFDGDADRRAAVVDGLRKPSLRACRKQHKQYYWKRPRTP
ncbi:related to transcription factor PLM2 [Cephalotrichum gorgonifer]|uniref:Related to transcription factor PLM2 n=1 Tax=Cephalotrichum gorgonifer TaxID=2041049 RepID=A0AAE8SS95_9PEZI|nr:related to transcription factor PLM2 [Cephalotrichum gorgonifer]